MNVRTFGRARASLSRLAAGLLAASLFSFGASAFAAWEPTKTVEFVVPAGTGGGADQMARLIQGIVTKHKLMKSSMVVVNKGGGAGAEGFLDSRTPRATRTRSSSPCPTCSRRRSQRACRSAGRTSRPFP